MAQNDEPEWDYVDVDRKSHELWYDQGWNAHKYAAKLALEALAEGKISEHAFWKAVEASLRPRNPTATPPT